MKHLLLKYSSHPMINIGDYIQSLAAKQYLKDPTLIERDEMNVSPLGTDTGKVIMNGWFTYKPENWPLTPNIDPLFVAFHLNNSCVDRFFSMETIQYLQKYVPIGCRDENTVTLLKQHGIDAYFSGCLTLTLGQTYKSTIRNNDIYIVDPLSYLPDNNSLKQILRTCLYFLIYLIPIISMLRKLKRENNLSFRMSKVGIGRILLFARAYVFMRKLITKELLKKAHYITHIYDNSELPTESQRFEHAESLLRKYAEAKMVITSRIHCALPCLALETPVVFIKSADDTIKSLCRFQGLEDFFNVIEIKNDCVVNSFLSQINRMTSFENKPTYQIYSKQLIDKCKQFISDEK